MAYIKDSLDNNYPTWKHSKFTIIDKYEIPTQKNNFDYGKLFIKILLTISLIVSIIIDIDMFVGNIWCVSLLSGF